MSEEPALGELLADHRRSPALFDKNRTPISLFTLDGVCVAANRAASAFLTDTTSDLTGAELGDLLGEGHAAEARRYLERAQAGESFAVRGTLRAKGGRHVAVLVEVTPAIFDERVVGAYVAWRDLSGFDAGQREIERRLQEVSSLFEHSLDSMLALDLQGRVTAANPAAMAMFGYERDALIGLDYRELVQPGWLEHTARMFVRAASGESFEDATVVLRRDGTTIDVEGTASPIFVDGTIVGLYAIGRDVTARRKLEVSVREQTERIRELYLVAATTGKSADDQIAAALELGMRRLNCEGAYLTQFKNGNVTYRNGAGTGTTLVGSIKPLTQSIHRLFLEGDESLAVDDFEVPPWNDEISRRRERRAFIGAPVILDGVPYGTVGFISRHARSEPFTTADRDFVRLIGALAASAIERGEQRRRLDTLAYFDALTGLPNRTLLAERLEETIDVARRRGRSFAVHFLDLDGFKFVNDHHGHPHGDQVLRSVAQRLARAVRKSDIVARLGGDEFVVLQPEIVRAGDALEVAGRLRELVAEPVMVGTWEHRLGCSIGIALYPHDGHDAETLLARADAALYSVKANGRNGVAFATAPR